jgi:glutamate--cysteine ligase
LLGLDLIKDVATLEAAYNDSRGVTAEFNRNALRVLNAELGATFDVDAFEHRAFYDKRQNRIEMHLVARGAQHVLVPGVGVIHFRPGETIRTEISCKYDRQSAEQLLAGAGWRIDEWLTDAEAMFALALARPATSGTALAPRTRSEARVRRALFHELVAQRAFSAPPQPRERVGAEIEFIALREVDGRVARFDPSDPNSILGAVRDAARRHHWREGESGKGAPWFGLPTGGRVTFEPGGQIEYAAPPRFSASVLLDDLVSAATTLRAACARSAIALLDCGIDPLNVVDAAPLQIGARRYRRMSAHFARIGPAGARMMRQTAGLHLSVDLGRDVGGRWRLLNALAPVLTATFANSRRYAGEDTGCASYRAQTWRAVDPARTGVLIGRDPVGEYVDLAVNAGAFLLGTDEGPAHAFGSWLDGGVAVADWEEHLGTLFPEVRPRGYFEVRSIDAIPETGWPAAVALVTGLTYDARAAREAVEVLGEPDAALLELAGRVGLADAALRRTASELSEIAIAGCRRLGPRFIAERHVEVAADVLGVLTR